MRRHPLYQNISPMGLIITYYSDTEYIYEYVKY